jgi:hypothetical protein
MDRATASARGDHWDRPGVTQVTLSTVLVIVELEYVIKER